MLYICKLSNKFDLNQAIRVSHSLVMFDLPASTTNRSLMLLTQKINKQKAARLPTGRHDIQQNGT